nr:unnamed protein product [Callosobruchus chinensis]
MVQNHQHPVTLPLPAPGGLLSGTLRRLSLWPTQLNFQEKRKGLEPGPRHHTILHDAAAEAVAAAARRSKLQQLLRPDRVCLAWREDTSRSRTSVVFTTSTNHNKPCVPGIET